MRTSTPVAAGLAEALSAGPSDAQLLFQLGLMLKSAPGPFLGPQLSTLVEHVCEAHCSAQATERAAELETALATYLNERRVLRFRQASPAGLDDWAASAPIVFVRAAVTACATCRGGGPR